MKIEQCVCVACVSEPVKAVSKGKRQAWTAPAMAAFFEGLCEVHNDVCS